MPFNPNQQANLVLDAFDPVQMLSSALNTKAPWDSIIDFAVHPSYCGKELFPRQATLLKLIFLETDNMTAYDFDVIEWWRTGLVKPRNAFGVQPDIWERVRYLKERGYRRFPHIQAVLGRRASKGFLGGILGCEQVAYLHSLDNPQKVYGIDAGKDVYLNVGATSQTVAMRQMFADIRTTIEGCRYFRPPGKPPWIAEAKDHIFRIRTPADLRRIAELRAARIPIDHQIASLVGVALSASGTAGRGATSYCLDPETPVLTADLRWVPLRSIQPGDEVVGVDEYPVSLGVDGRDRLQRKLRKATVLARTTTTKKAYRLTFHDGREVTCSADHRWLLRRKKTGAWDWRVTRGPTEFHSLKIGDQIVQVVEPWDEDASRDAGYLAGVFDGEGSLYSGSGLSVQFSQNPGLVLDKTLHLLKEKGFSPQPNNHHALRSDGLPVKLCQQWAVRGVAEGLRFLGQIRPERLLAKAPRFYDGVAVRGKGSTRYEQPTYVATIVSIEELPERELIDIQTSTATFVANGLISHNCNVFDEFAFHVQTGSVKSDTQIYKDWQPSLGQFGMDSLTYIPSSPACLQPSTPVLTEDLRWVPVGSLQVGDRLIGFDEFAPPGKGQGRKWRPTTVTETSVFEAPRYELVTASGKHITSTGDHLWLSRRSQDNYTWVQTTDLKPGDKIKSIGTDPWEVDESRDGGYLAGFFDGEGHLAVGGVQMNLGFTQRPGPIYDKVEALLQDRKFDVKTTIAEAHPDPARRQPNPIAKAYINGGFPEIMRFLGTIRPERLLPKLVDRLYGSRIYGRSSQAIDRVVSVTRVNDGPVVALGTSTSTLVAEGLLSHNTKVGMFHTLYEQGKIPMSTYNDTTGIGEETRQTLVNNGVTIELDAEPTWLIYQGPSWSLYEDWQNAPKLLESTMMKSGVFYAFPKAPEPDLSDERQMRERRRDPQKFGVEKEGQFAEVEGAYLDADKVDAMFARPSAIDPETGERFFWREELRPQVYGTFDRVYRMHCDPGLSGANFAMAIGHLEDAPPDEHGRVWPHVVFDLLKVWRPMDAPEDPETGKQTIDYVQVHDDLDDVISRFMTLDRVTFDQWQSQSFIAQLRQKFAPQIPISKVDFNDKTNQFRMGQFKSALNLGWVHSYADNFYFDDQSCLLELELKYLSMKPNGKVDRQEFGPVITKDLADCVMQVTVDLLGDALDRYSDSHLAAHAFGTSNVSALRAAEDPELALKIQSMPGGDILRGNAREMMAQQATERMRNQQRGLGRGGHQPDRLNSIHRRNDGGGSRRRPR